MNYKLISSSDSIVYIQFPGKFKDIELIWDAKIQTLNSLLQNNSNFGIRQFIDITNSGDELRSISIGFNVTKITKSEILKTIIMIRQYKNLQVGRHEYGEIHYLK